MTAVLRLIILGFFAVVAIGVFFIALHLVFRLLILGAVVVGVLAVARGWRR